MFELLWYGLVASLLSLAGGVVVLVGSQGVRKVTNYFMAFGAGAFMAVAFLDLLPESVEQVSEPHNIFWAALVGFFIYFALERFLMRYFHTHKEGHTHGDHTESLSLLLVLGDSLHNFLDGIVIALAYVANPALGLGTALAVAAHEVPQEIADFTILLDRGWSKAKIFWVNLASASLAIVGVVVGYYAATTFEARLPYLLAGVAGIFTYIAASELIPEVHHRAGHKHMYRVLLAFVVGVILIAYLVGIAHE